MCGAVLFWYWLNSDALVSITLSSFTLSPVLIIKLKESSNAKEFQINLSIYM